MKKIGQKSGLTLVELIVASMLIAIVLLGVVAFNLSLTQIQDDSFNQSTLSIQASTAMNYLEDDISMAVGTFNNVGFRTRPGTLCLRRPDNTPLNLDDNPWICYIFDNGNRNLQRCVPVNLAAPTIVCNTVLPVTNLVKLANGNFMQVGIPNVGLIRIVLNANDGTGYYSMTTDIGMKNHSF